jgi:hypothetical protein
MNRSAEFLPVHPEVLAALNDQRAARDRRFDLTLEPNRLVFGEDAAPSSIYRIIVTDRPLAVAGELINLMVDHVGKTVYFDGGEVSALERDAFMRGFEFGFDACREQNGYAPDDAPCLI